MSSSLDSSDQSLPFFGDHERYSDIIYTFGPAPNRQTLCLICLEGLLPTESTLMHIGGECMNSFHTECLGEYLKMLEDEAENRHLTNGFRSSTGEARSGVNCPLCRAELWLWNRYTIRRHTLDQTIDLLSPGTTIFEVPDNDDEYAHIETLLGISEEPEFSQSDESLSTTISTEPEDPMLTAVRAAIAEQSSHIQENDPIGFLHSHAARRALNSYRGWSLLNDAVLPLGFQIPPFEEAVSDSDDSVDSDSEFDFIPSPLPDHIDWLMFDSGIYQTLQGNPARYRDSRVLGDENDWSAAEFRSDRRFAALFDLYNAQRTVLLMERIARYLIAEHSEG